MRHRAAVFVCFVVVVVLTAFAGYAFHRFLIDPPAGYAPLSAPLSALYGLQTVVMPPKLPPGCEVSPSTGTIICIQVNE